MTTKVKKISLRQPVRVEFIQPEINLSLYSLTMTTMKRHLAMLSLDREIVEAWLIKFHKPNLNVQEASVPLQLF